MAQRKIDWEAIKTEYVTTKTSLRELEKKHKIPYKEIRTHSAREGWVKARKDYTSRLTAKITSKICDKEANKRVNELSGLLDASFNLRDRIIKATEDPEQFNRYLVTRGRKGGEFETVEEVHEKVDTKAIREMTQALKTIEGLIRSLNNIPTEAEMQRLQLERERFEMEREKWEREKAEQSAAHEVRIVFDTDDMEGWTE